MLYKKGNIPWIKGKHHTEESNEKNRQSHLGQVAWNKGIPRSKEVKRKISEANKGQIPWNKGQCNFDKKNYKKQYYQDNKEKWAIRDPEYMKNYRKTENGKASKQRSKSRRRAIMKEIVNTLTSQEWLDLLEAHDYKCAYCGVEFDCENLPEKDHVIPISKGGDNIKENIVPACRNCNAKKRNKDICELDLAISAFGSCKEE